MLRLVMLIVWAAVIGSFLGLVPSPFAKWLTLLGSVLLLAHLAEYFIFSKKIADKRHSSMKGFFMTMVFGVIYINDRKHFRRN